MKYIHCRRKSIVLIIMVFKTEALSKLAKLLKAINATAESEIIPPPKKLKA